MLNSLQEELNESINNSPSQVPIVASSTSSLMGKIKENIAKLHETNVAITESFEEDEEELKKSEDGIMLDPEKYASRIKEKLSSYRIWLPEIIISILERDSHMDEEMREKLNGIKNEYSKLLSDFKKGLDWLTATINVDTKGAMIQLAKKGGIAEKYFVNEENEKDEKVRQFIYGSLALTGFPELMKDMNYGQLSLVMQHPITCTAEDLRLLENNLIEELTNAKLEQQTLEAISNVIEILYQEIKERGNGFCAQVQTLSEKVQRMSGIFDSIKTAIISSFAISRAEGGSVVPSGLDFTHFMFDEEYSFPLIRAIEDTIGFPKKFIAKGDLLEQLIIRITGIDPRKNNSEMIFLKDKNCTKHPNFITTRINLGCEWVPDERIISLNPANSTLSIPIMIIQVYINYLEFNLMILTERKLAFPLEVVERYITLAEKEFNQILELMINFREKIEGFNRAIEKLSNSEGALKEMFDGILKLSPIAQQRAEGTIAHFYGKMEGDNDVNELGLEVQSMQIEDSSQIQEKCGENQRDSCDRKTIEVGERVAKVQEVKDLHETNEKFNENEGLCGDKSNNAKGSLKEGEVMQSPQSQETKTPEQELTNVDAQRIRVGQSSAQSL